MNCRVLFRSRIIYITEIKTVTHYSENCVTVCRVTDLFTEIIIILSVIDFDNLDPLHNVLPLRTCSDQKVMPPGFPFGLYPH